MLRSTDPLRRHCQVCHYFVRPMGWSLLTEFEFLPLNPRMNGVPAFPSDFRWDEFCNFWPKERCGLLELFRCIEEFGLVSANDVAINKDSPRSGPTILWLSDEIFLSETRFCFSNSHDLRHRQLCQYEVRFWLRPACHIYSLASFSFNGMEQATDPAASDIPLHFFRHIAPQLPVGCMRGVYLVGGRSVFPPELFTLFLSIFPPSGLCLESMPRSTCYGVDQADGIREAQLVAVMSHHFSSESALILGRIHAEVPLDRINQLLLECRSLRHLVVPTQLIDFESSDIPFTANPQFQSLLILEDYCSEEISFSLLDGVALNRFRILDSQTAVLEKLRHIFGHVIPKCCSLRSLSVELDERYGSRIQYENVTQVIAAATLASYGAGNSRLGSLVSITMKYSERQSSVVLSPNETWDRVVSPSLSLSWSLQQRNVHSWSKSPKLALPPGLIGQAVLQTNRNVVYKKTTEGTPCDSRTANASVIYDFVQAFHRSFGTVA
jgi:hypothetical protein